MFVQIRCELCGKTFDHDASALGAAAECPHCGKTNPAPALAPAPAPAPAAPGGPAVKRCPACQAEIEADAVICIHCGQNLATGRKVGGRHGLAAHKSLVLAGLAGAALAAGLLAFVLWPEADAPPPFDPAAIAAAAKKTPPPAAAAPDSTSAAPVAPPHSAVAAPEIPPATNPPAPAAPTPAELASQQAETERAALAALQEKKFEAEQNLRLQLDVREPLYAPNELVELRRKNGIVDKGTFTGFAGEGTNRVALVATALGEVGVPIAVLDPASRRRLDPEFREAFIQHLLETRFAAPAAAPAP